jgi:hypothetical protein
MVQAIHRRVWFNRQAPSEVVGPDLDLPSSFTIGIRFKTNGFKDDYQTLINKDDTGTPTSENYHMRISGVAPGVNNLFGRFGTGAGLVDVSGGTIVTDGVWHHGVLVHDAAAQTLTLYLDGMRDAAPTATGGVAPTTNASLLRIGRWPGTAFGFTGYVASVEIYNRALSEAEVAYNYRHPNNPTRIGLQLSWTQDSIDQPAAGTWQDRSGNARNGALTNTVTSKYPAIRAGANALFFPTAAGTDVVDCGNGASLNPATTGLISVECWVNAKIFNVVATPVVFAQKWLGNVGYTLAWLNGYLYLYVADGFGVTGVTGLSLNSQWQHIVATYTGGAATGKIYVNGVDKTSASLAKALGNPAQNLYIGNSFGFVNSPVGGHMAATRIYNRVLTPAEVLYNFQHPNNPIKRGRVLDLSPESLYGTRWYDLSGNANHGTITGAIAKNIGLLTGR